jgi:hypothetical protein
MTPDEADTWAFVFEFADGTTHTFMKRATLAETEDVLTYIVHRLTVEKLPLRVGVLDSADELVVNPGQFVRVVRAPLQTLLTARGLASAERYRN